MLKRGRSRVLKLHFSLYFFQSPFEVLENVMLFHSKFLHAEQVCAALLTPTILRAADGT